MKRLFFLLFILSILLPHICLSQDKNVSDSAKTVVENRIKMLNEKIKEKGYKWKAGVTNKSYLSEQELKNLCGELYNKDDVEDDLEKQAIMYQNYIDNKSKTLHKTLTVPDWQGMMSDIEDQACSNCWAHACTAVTEGLLHYQYGSNIGVDLSEDTLTGGACSGCSGGFPGCGFSYIYNYGIPSEDGINSFPNFDHGKYKVASYYVNEPTSINYIKSILESSPVYTSMYVYTDFAYDYESGIYSYTSGSLLGSHAVVILGVRSYRRFHQKRTNTFHPARHLIYSV